MCAHGTSSGLLRSPPSKNRSERRTQAIDTDVRRKMSKSMWIGSPQSYDEGRALYRSCQIESGAAVSIGDYVHMLPADPSLQLYIARIDDLFETEEKKYVQVRWFYRQTELKHSPPCAPAENEVYHTNYYDCQLIQSIVGFCHVVRHTDCPVEPLTSSISRKEKENRTDLYVCRYSYSEETGEFVEALPLDFEFKVCSASKDDDKPAENVDVDDKELIDLLMQIECNLSLPENEIWPARRVAWLNKVKAITSIEEVKQTLMDLEDEFHIFINEPGWREQVLSIQSSNMLLHYIKNLSQKMQMDAEISDHEKLEANCLNKLTSPGSYCKEHKRKRATTVSMNSPISKKQASEGLACSFICKGIYKLKQGNLPPDAPPHLNNLRAALVYDTRKDYVTIAYPSLASLAECFGDINMVMENSFHERKHTWSLFNQSSESTCMMPRLDEKFRMTQKTAQKALKCLIPSPEYLKQGHLPSFWLRSAKFTMGRTKETPAVKDDNSCSAKEIFSSSLNQSEQRPPDENLQVPDVHPDGRTVKGETHDISQDDDNNNNHNSGEVSENSGKPSKDGSYSHQRETTNGTLKMSIVMPLGAANCGNPVSTEEMQDTKAKCVSAEAFVDKPDSNLYVEENKCFVRWGARKKISHQNRCRGNAHGSDDFRNKIFSYQDRVPKDRLHELAGLGSGMNKNKHVALIGKAKMLRVPKEMQGRWSSERYKAAQLKLFQIMKDKGAVPGKPLLRPALREEARKHIGDTGLLDHLLKHMTDTVINNGERFRRRHNSEGAMEYWLEDARLQEMRKQAGVDQYWIPPYGWKFGDAITNSKGDGLSQSQLNELRSLREDVEKLKSQLHHIHLHLGTSSMESKSTTVFGHACVFQPWKKIESANEQQKETVNFMDYPVELNCIEASTEVMRDSNSPTQADEIHASMNIGSLYANVSEDKAHQNELCEMATKSMRGRMDKGENNSGEELSLFYKAAQSSLKMSPVKLLDTSKGYNEKKTSPSTAVLRRSPCSGARKADENKENIDVEKHQSEVMKACKPQIIGPRQVLSPNSANLQLCSGAQITSPTENKLRLKLGPLSSRQAPDTHT